MTLSTCALKYLLMQRQQQTVQLRFQHPAPHAEGRVEHLAQTLRRGRRGKREKQNTHILKSHTHTGDMDSLQMDRD